MTKEDAVKLLCEHFSEGMVRTIMDALKQEQGEPVAYFNPQEGGFYWAKPTTVTSLVTVDVEPLPLYTTPQTKEWIGLTETQIDKLEKEFIGFPVPNIYNFVQAIEAKLKQKNNIGVND